jgi:DNA repair exonuclease SbcCD ATPase subunit
MGTCSVCGQSPAVLIDAYDKGTYWLCGECVAERIQDARDAPELRDKLRLAQEQNAVYQERIQSLLERARKTERQLADAREAYLRLEAFSIAAHDELMQASTDFMMAAVETTWRGLADWQRKLIER